MISIICVYNDIKVLRENLVRTLKFQTSRFEFIPIRNTEAEYDRMSIPYNYGANKASGDLLIFVHQDVALEDQDFLFKVSNILHNYKYNMDGVFGVIGSNENGKIIGFIKENIAFVGKPIDSPTKVETLDDSILILKRDSFEKVGGFDEAMLGWHGYGAVLSIKYASFNLGTYALPFFICHNTNDQAFRSYALPNSLRYLIEHYNVRNLNNPSWRIKDWNIQKADIPFTSFIQKGNFLFKMSKLCEKGSISLFLIVESSDSTYPNKLHAEALLPRSNLWLNQEYMFISKKTRSDIIDPLVYEQNTTIMKLNLAGNRYMLVSKTGLVNKFVSMVLSLTNNYYIAACLLLLLRSLSK